MNQATLQKMLKESKVRLAAVPSVAGSKPSHYLSLNELAKTALLPRNLPRDHLALIFEIHLNSIPPSITPLDQLEHISVSDLLLETKHTGKVIYLNYVCDAGLGAGTRSVVKDAAGKHVPVQINDFEDAKGWKWACATKIAIKEPYLTQDPHGNPMLKVVHVSDIVCISTPFWTAPRDSTLPGADGPIPAEMMGEFAAGMFKELGNEQHRAKNYHKALWIYSGALQHASGEHIYGLHKTLYRNRSTTNLRLERYEAALADAEASLLVTADNLPEAMICAKNIQALIRASKASSSLGDYSQAREHINAAAVLSPEDTLVKAEKQRLKRRIEETQLGNYDFFMLDKLHAEGHPRLDFGSFTSSVKVDDTAAHGRGLFATKAFKTGDLILCEKAFAIGEKRTAPAPYRAFSMAQTKRIYPDAMVMLADAVTRKLRNNPSLYRDFKELCGASSMPAYPLQEIDGNIVIDEFKILGIVSQNTFPCSKERKFDAVSTPLVYDLTAGIWLVASAVNHACVGNAMRSFRGDMMLLRATKDIKVGEEITMPYIFHYGNHPKMVSDLQTSWNFKCDCAICQAEAQVSALQRRQREHHAQQALNLLLAQRKKPKFTQAVNDKMLGHLHSIEATYDDNIYGTLPRIALGRFGFNLTQFYFGAKKYEDCIQHGLAALKHLGFEITFKKNRAHINCQQSLLCEQPIIIMLDICKSYDALGKKRLAEDFTTVAHLLQTAFYGDDLDFSRDRMADANFLFHPIENENVPLALRGKPT